MIKVEGHPDLYRDEATGAIVSMSSDYDKYIKVRSLRAQKAQQRDQEIQDLKSEMADIKQMMVHILDKLNGK